MKPYYEADGKTIYLGDNKSVLPELVDPIDSVITDPPYGISFDTDYRRFSSGFVERKAHTPVHGDTEAFDPAPWLKYRRVVLWGANCFSSRLPLGSWLVWDKRFGNGKAFLADAEAAWMNSGHGIYLHSVSQQGFIRPEPIDHPTQKPLAVMEWCIVKAKPKGVILDPYMGSGTTLVAAKNLGYPAIGIEIEERYCEIAAKRLAQEVMQFGPIYSDRVDQTAAQEGSE